MTPITSFEGEHRFLSNFWLVPGGVTLEDDDRSILYPTTEHAYQAAKTLDPSTRREIAAAVQPGLAKRAGKNVLKRLDWDEVKLSVMEDLLRQKFTIPSLREKLLATGEAELIEGNTWNDVFWGVCCGRGENHLGRLLMKIREELRS